MKDVTVGSSEAPSKTSLIPSASNHGMSAMVTIAPPGKHFLNDALSFQVVRSAPRYFIWCTRGQYLLFLRQAEANIDKDKVNIYSTCALNT